MMIDVWQQNLFMFFICFVESMVIVTMWVHICELRDKIAEMENAKVVPFRRKAARNFEEDEMRADFARRHPSQIDFQPAGNFYDQDADRW